jgi:hypothetical protein
MTSFKMACTSVANPKIHQSYYFEGQLDFCFCVTQTQMSQDTYENFSYYDFYLKNWYIEQLTLEYL